MTSISHDRDRLWEGCWKGDVNRKQPMEDGVGVLAMLSFLTQVVSCLGLCFLTILYTLYI